MHAFMWFVFVLGIGVMNEALGLDMTFFEILALPSLIMALVILDDISKTLKEGKNGKV